MKVQYGALSPQSVQIAGGQQGSYCKWQAVKRKKQLRRVSPDGLWQTLVWRCFCFLRENSRFLFLPVVRRRMLRIGLMMAFLSIACNMFCFYLIEGADREMAVLAERQAAAETTNILLRARRAKVWAPDNLRKLAAEKLHLAPATSEQVAVFDRKRGLFR